jgi:predicted permease
MPFFLRDSRFAIRALLKRPGFAAVAIATLALGIGATTAIFSVVDAILLRPLPYPQPERLVELHIQGGDGEAYPLPDTDFLAWRAQNTAFDSLAVYDSGQGVSLTGDANPERLVVNNVSDAFFTVLGGVPYVGRTFQPRDGIPGAPKAVVLSFAFWQRHFHRDPSVVGREMMLDGAPHTIVGVMPAAFSFLRTDYDLWRVLAIAPPPRRGPFYTFGVARLKPQVSLEQARASLEPIAAGIKAHNPGPGDWKYSLVPLHEHIVGNVSRILYLLVGAVALLLTIAVANVANLLLSRASSRDREIAVRGALGASRGRIVAQLVTESVVLGIAGGVCGLAVAAWGTRALLAMAPEGIPRLEEVGMSVPVFLFALGVAALAGLFFGLAPALRASRAPLVETLKDGRAGGGAGHRRLQRGLIVAEIALALMLSVGAGLMIRSIAALERVNPGFVPHHALTFGLSVPRTSYDTPEKISALYETLLGKLQTLPAVVAAGSTVSLPPDSNAMTDNFMVEGQTLPPNQSAPVAPLLITDEGFFKALGVPLLAGRLFDERDALGKPGVVIVNETLARRYFPNGNAVGKRLKDGGPERPTNPFMEIVGVVGDVKYEGLDQRPTPAFYLAMRQMPQARRYIVLRTATDPGSVVNTLRDAVRSVDKDLPVGRIWSMDELMTQSVAPPRFRTAIVTIFAVAGLLLAAIGIYGVMAYAVTERTRELGLRIALGASTRDLFRLVLSEAIVLAASGVVVGMAGAAASANLIRSLLFGVTPFDTATFAGIAVLLVATALAASYVPARRAIGVDPMVALRHE